MPIMQGTLLGLTCKSRHPGISQDLPLSPFRHPVIQPNRNDPSALYTSYRYVVPFLSDHALHSALNLLPIVIYFFNVFIFILYFFS